MQQMDPARVGPRHHMQLGRDSGHVGTRLHGRAQRQHRTVRQRRLAQRAALRVEPLGSRVQHHRTAPALAAPLGLGGTPVARDRRGQARRHRGQRRPGGRGDQHIAARGTRPRLRGRPQRIYDGQPDLHRRQRSLLHGRPHDGDEAAPRSPTADFPHRTRARRPVTGGILAPATDNPPPPTDK
ncbi:hypothetical protein SAV31267_040570 [Streptomyces avermitilis]|uniref:Uncharacterized protein n=1 Tax=Streptomyces avermitilis TaxID=33903 RepID=A0A4D4MQX8_STRAX|nr:hypothetical protein SAV31267_040570 [Streptomyces avermitilis]